MKKIITSLFLMGLLAVSTNSYAEEGNKKMGNNVVQTAGRQQLGDFAPMFAKLNDDVLFGEVWNDDTLNLKTRSIITVVALMSSGITNSSLKYHLENAKRTVSVKRKLLLLLLMQLCMLAGQKAGLFSGWPKKSGTKKNLH